MESEKVSVVSPFLEKVCGYIGAALLLIAMAGAVMGQILDPQWMWLSIIGFPGGFIVLIMMGLLPGKCWADGDGVNLAMPFQGVRTIPYSEISSAYIGLKMGAKPSAVFDTRELIHTLHIITNGEDIHFTKKSGKIDSPMSFANGYARMAALERSPFAEIIEYVKDYCGDDVVEDMYW